jgi:hypothetical protein
MIKKYLHSVQQKPTHERRAHAMQIATSVTAFALLVWVTTLGVRFATPSTTATTAESDQVASVASAQDGSNATLLVATTTNSF